MNDKADHIETLSTKAVWLPLSCTLIGLSLTFANRILPMLSLDYAKFLFSLDMTYFMLLQLSYLLAETTLLVSIVASLIYFKRNPIAWMCLVISSLLLSWLLYLNNLQEIQSEAAVQEGTSTDFPIWVAPSD